MKKYDTFISEAKKATSYVERDGEFFKKIQTLEGDIHNEIYNFFNYYQVDLIKFNPEYDDTVSIIHPNMDTPEEKEVCSIRNQDGYITLTIDRPDDLNLSDVWRINDLYTIYQAIINKADETYKYQEELVKNNKIDEIKHLIKKGVIVAKIKQKYPHIFTSSDLNLL